MKALGRIFTLASMFSGVLLFPMASLAAEEWEASITVQASTAENRLSFGQKANATDGPDGAHDVPAMLNGDIKASFKSSNGIPYWRDIKAAAGTVKSWNLVIESALGNATVTVRWKPSAINASAAFLLDERGGVLADMKNESAYSYTNEGRRNFRIKIMHQ